MGVAVVLIGAAKVVAQDTCLRLARLWAPSREGKRISISIVWHKDRSQKDGARAPVVDGYSAYGITSDAEFSNSDVSLLDRGFAVATLQVRGGADLGQDWYEDGRLMSKQNTFDKSVHALTTMLDETILRTTNEWTQWCDPREKPAYDSICAYSPYDNIEAKPYPAMLVTTGLWDSQAKYYEPAKYVARLRRMKTDANPLYFHIHLEAGHGGQSGRFERLKETALVQAFFMDLAQLVR